MSDAGSGGRFPFLKRNRNEDTPSSFSQRMDPHVPTTGEINQIFAIPRAAWTKKPSASTPWRWLKA